MEPHLYEAWGETWEAIRERAWWRLDHAAELPPSVSGGRPFHGLPRLRIRIDPSTMATDSEPTTLTVYELFTNGYRRDPVVREAIWFRMEDLRRTMAEVERTGGPMLSAPTIAVGDARVPADQLATFIAEVAEFRVPLTWPQDTVSVTSDAATYGFEFFSRDQPTASVALEWSHDTPPEWEPFLEWYWRLQRFLTNCLGLPVAH